MTRNYDVIAVGGVTMDAFMKLHDTHEKYHFDEKTGELCFRHGEKINVERYDFCMGGDAANVAVGISRLGLKAGLCAETGDDEFSIKIRNTLARENIERLLVVQKPGPSNFSVIINYKGDRTIFSQHHERENDFQLLDVAAKYLYVTSLGGQWERAYKRVLDFAKEHDIKITFNPGSPQLREANNVVSEILKNTEILFVNKEEAEKLIFDRYPEKNDDSDDYIKTLAVKLQEIGVKTVVITNGKDGSYCLDKDGEFHIQKMIPGEIVERTGAGDAFASGFLGATVSGLSIKEAMHWGSANAAAVVGAIGAETGLLTKEKMLDRVSGVSGVSKVSEA